jgi:hypothetical protein
LSTDARSSRSVILVLMSDNCHNESDGGQE